MSWYEWVIYGFSSVTVIGQALLVLAVVSYVPGLSLVRGFMERRVLTWMFVIALTATAGSLFFSEIAGIEPCKLCWLQRIFMYPQAIILLVAVVTSDQRVWRYVLPLSLVGGAIAGWHYGENVWTVLHPADPTTPCSLDGISCAVPPFVHFGYVTIPLMAFTAFALECFGCAWLLKAKSA